MAFEAQLLNGRVRSEIYRLSSEDVGGGGEMQIYVAILSKSLPENIVIDV